MEINPLSIILVKSDSKGDRMLFRYPHVTNLEYNCTEHLRKKSPYSIVIADDSLKSLPFSNWNINRGNLTGLSDEVLSTLFAVKPELCEMKFELKVNNVRFVGHPTLLPSFGFREVNSSILFNVVFALQAQANYSIVKCYYDLSKRLGIALRHEEKRSGFLTEEIKLMVSTHDEIAAQSAEESDIEESPYELILQKSSLARDLKSVFNNLSTSGIIHIMIDKWIQVSFCLPQKLHQIYQKGFTINPEIIDRCLSSLRPYHGLLLLTDAADLLKLLPKDYSPMLHRLLKKYNPLASLQTLAAETDLTLAQIFQLTGHLVYWGKATIIYPLCKSNVYVISPSAVITHHLLQQFSEHFPGICLIKVISEFSLPTPLCRKLNFLTQSHLQIQFVQIIIWLLKNHLLMQLHTYIQYIPTTRRYKRMMTENPLKERLSKDLCSSQECNISIALSHCSWTFGSIANSDNLLDKQAHQIKDTAHNDNCSTASDDFILLERLCRLGYFNGGHHIEEIMYLENIHRSQVYQIIDKFRDVLITCENDDPAMTHFYL